MALKERMQNSPVDDYADLMAECEFDPLKFVTAAFPWGEPGTILENKKGPREWQKQVLNKIKEKLKDGCSSQDAVRIAVASGHGIGKSALVSWVILWALATKVNTRGVITANTAGQLSAKTWAEVAKWFNLFIGNSFFDQIATSIAAKDPAFSKTWRVDAIPWSVDNTEAFAGLHNEGSRILVVFDEASSIDDKIWEVTEGALTDDNTQIIWAVFGNPTRNQGRFRECFRGFAHRWDHRNIDSRTVDGTNKAQFDQWVQDYGEDSDFVKIRVKGEFPNQSENAILSAIDIQTAVDRKIDPESLADLAKVIGCDVAREGDDSTQIVRRQGPKAWGFTTLNKATCMEVADALTNDASSFSADGVFLDGTGGFGGGVYDCCNLRNLDTFLIHFNSKPSDSQFFNKRSEMIWKMCEWIKQEGCIPNDKELREELSVIQFVYQGDKIRIVEKKDIKKQLGRSPDKADALALTFAYNVLPKPKYNRGTNHVADWDPFVDA